MTNYERIKACVHASDVSADDMKTMNDVFAEVDDRNLGDIADLFEKHKSWVGKFNDNRKAKQKAMTAADPALFAEILEQEKKYLQDLTYGLD